MKCTHFYYLDEFFFFELKLDSVLLWKNQRLNSWCPIMNSTLANFELKWNPPKRQLGRQSRFIWFIKGRIQLVAVERGNEISKVMLCLLLFYGEEDPMLKLGAKDLSMCWKLCCFHEFNVFPIIKFGLVPYMTRAYCKISLESHLERVTFLAVLLLPISIEFLK